MKSQPGSPALACNLDALAPEQRRKHEAVSIELFHKASAVHDLPNGLALQFQNEAPTLSLVAEFIVDEAQCCPFLDFDVHVDPRNALLQMSLTGPGNTKEFLQAEFADLLRS